MDGKPGGAFVGCLVGKTKESNEADSNTIVTPGRGFPVAKGGDPVSCIPTGQ